MSAPRLILSLHDVTPAHAKRLERAERLFGSLGLSSITYLLVPDYHATGPAHASPDFVAWCRAPRRFVVQWFLHGYFHRDTPSRDEKRATCGEWLARRFMTQGEAEFLTLRDQDLRTRLDAGIRGFERCLGAMPIGFVSPAWLFNDQLLPALAARRFRFTESHLRVFQVQTGRERRCPVITWATRSPLMRYSSSAVSAALHRFWRAQPIVRVALHPLDFDHPGTVASITRTLDALRRDRRVAPYDDSLFTTED